MKDPRFGSQQGLLSERECATLIGLIQVGQCPGYEVLEVGHYLGLSTYALVTGLRQGPDDWHLTTVDAHIQDGWVGPTDPAQFLENMQTFGFDDPRITVLLERSETLQAPLPYDVVFYDGDHGPEQARFTEVVIASPRVSLFIFDDRDFEVPARCHQRLQEAGWEDASPALVRGEADKMDPETMTLGVWIR